MNKQQLKLCEDVLWYHFNGPSEKFLEAIQNLDKETKRIREIFNSIEEYRYNDVIPNDMMLYLEGSKVSFRCEICGANVFRKLKYKKDKYKCNGCGEIYTGKSEE